MSQHTRWTAQQLADYAKRRLAASGNARREIRERMQRMPAGEIAEVIDDPERAAKAAELGWPINDMKNAVKKARNGYNTAVVLAWCKEFDLPAPDFEFQFHPDRKWRMDLAFVAHPRRVYVEVQGGLHTGGRHTRGAALLREYEKINAASARGWLPIFVTPAQLLSAQTAQLIRAALAI